MKKIALLLAVLTSALLIAGCAGEGNGGNGGNGEITNSNSGTGGGLIAQSPRIEDAYFEEINDSPEPATFVTVVDVDTSGYLYSLASPEYWEPEVVRITVDGVTSTIDFDYYGEYYDFLGERSILEMNIRFNSGLKVEAIARQGEYQGYYDIMYWGLAIFYSVDVP